MARRTPASMSSVAARRGSHRRRFGASNGDGQPHARGYLHPRSSDTHSPTEIPDPACRDSHFPRHRYDQRCPRYDYPPDTGVETPRVDGDRREHFRHTLAPPNRLAEEWDLCVAAGPRQSGLQPGAEPSATREESRPRPAGSIAGGDTHRQGDGRRRRRCSGTLPVAGLHRGFGGGVLRGVFRGFREGGRGARSGVRAWGGVEARPPGRAPGFSGRERC